MLSSTSLRSARGLTRLAARSFTAKLCQFENKGVTLISPTESPVPKKESQVPAELPQAPNRNDIWSRSQQPRKDAMTGPRFERTDFDLQGVTRSMLTSMNALRFKPQSYAAIELIHKQPVRWTPDRVVACDGGGGPAGHPRIFINTDKPEIAVCGYCGLPFANEHHRKHLESLPFTSYPLEDVEGVGFNPPLSRPRSPH